MSPERKEYTRYRGIQQERIEKAAEKLFIAQGIRAVSVDAIAQEAQISRRTFYQYFQNKEELALAIFERFRAARSADYESRKLHSGNGFQRLSAELYDMCSMLDDRPEYMRLLVEFDALFSREEEPALFWDVYDRGAGWICRIISEGIADGSIREDVNPQLLSTAIINMIAGMNSRLALLGKPIGKLSGTSSTQLMQFTCQVFLDGLKK